MPNPPPPTAPQTVEHPSGSRIGWQRPPWFMCIFFATASLCTFQRPVPRMGQILSPSPLLKIVNRYHGTGFPILSTLAGGLLG